MRLLSLKVSNPHTCRLWELLLKDCNKWLRKHQLLCLFISQLPFEYFITLDHKTFSVWSEQQRGWFWDWEMRENEKVKPIRSDCPFPDSLPFARLSFCFLVSCVSSPIGSFLFYVQQWKTEGYFPEGYFSKLIWSKTQLSWKTLQFDICVWVLRVLRKSHYHFRKILLSASVVMRYPVFSTLTV